MNRLSQFIRSLPRFRKKSSPEVIPRIELMCEAPQPPESLVPLVPCAPDVSVLFLRSLFCVGTELPDMTAYERTLLTEMRQVFGQDSVVDLVPRLSGSLPRLLSMLRSDSSVQVISEQIAADPALVSTIIKTINSPLYRMRERDIETLNHAVVILGERGLREIIASITMRPIVSVRSFSGLNQSLTMSLWEDAISCAVICRTLAERCNHHDPFAMYLCGLTYSVGLTAILGVIADGSKRDTPELFSDPFVEELAGLYPQLSSALMNAWNFPEASRITLSVYASGNSQPTTESELLTAGVQLTQLRSLARGGLIEGIELEELLVSLGLRDDYHVFFQADDQSSEAVAAASRI